jgi:RNA polymerase sigma-70 factor (ECF subfamily)
MGCCFVGAERQALHENIRCPAATANDCYLGLLAEIAAPQPGPDPETRARAALDSGDLNAVITTLMQAYGGPVFAYCRAMLRSQDQPADVLQTVFLEAYRSLPRFERRSSFKTWLFGIARHQCIDHLRRVRWQLRHVRRWTERPPVAPDALPDERGLAEERRRDLEACIERLAPRARDLVLLRFRQELSYDELAELTGVTSGTLRVRLYRALSALRECLERREQRA